MENPPSNDRTPRLRYFALVMAAFVTVLLQSNIVGAAKLSAVPVPF